MILYIFQNCTYFDKKKNLREIYEDTQKLEQGVLGAPKIWDRVSPGNLSRVSNSWPEPKHVEIACGSFSSLWLLLLWKGYGQGSFLHPSHSQAKRNTYKL